MLRLRQMVAVAIGFGRRARPLLVYRAMVPHYRHAREHCGETEEMEHSLRLFLRHSIRPFSSLSLPSLFLVATLSHSFARRLAAPIGWRTLPYPVPFECAWPGSSAAGSYSLLRPLSSAVLDSFVRESRGNNNKQ